MAIVIVVILLIPANNIQFVNHFCIMFPHANRKGPRLSMTSHYDPKIKNTFLSTEIINSLTKPTLL